MTVTEVHISDVIFKIFGLKEINLVLNQQYIIEPRYNEHGLYRFPRYRTACYT